MVLEGKVVGGGGAVPSWGLVGLLDHALLYVVHCDAGYWKCKCENGNS